MTPTGIGLIGVRVSTNLPQEGFTMTRDDGWFDLMVNGGGPVMLQFGRNPYLPLRLHKFVPWNEIVVLDPVVLGVEEKEAKSSDSDCIRKHDVDRMKPIVLATWNYGYRGQPKSADGFESSDVIVESQSLRQSMPLPAFPGASLVYETSRARGYMSIVRLRLTPRDPPKDLVKVHLRITVEGVVHERVFEADPDIRYTFPWDRLNEYRQVGWFAWKAIELVFPNQLPKTFLHL